MDINEKLKELYAYSDEITNRLLEANSEKQAYLDKIKDGEKLTKKEAKQNKLLVTKAKLLEQIQQLLNDLIGTKDFKKDFEVLKSSKSTKEEKESAKKDLLKIIAKINQGNIKELENIVDLPKDVPFTAENIKETLERDIKNLEEHLAEAEEKDLEEDIEYISKDLEYKKDDLEFVQDYIKNNPSIEATEKVLDAFSELSDKGKSIEAQDILEQKYLAQLNNYQADLTTQINKLEDELKAFDKNKKSEAKASNNETKEETLVEEKESNKNKVVSFFQRNWKKLTAAGVSIFFIISLIITIKSLNKIINNDEKTNEDPSYGTEDSYEKSEIEKLYENIDLEKLESLVEKGYDEYTALLMLQNFDNNLIESLLNLPLIKKVENYAEVKEFKLDYLEDYENARNKYAIPTDVIVDEVNRAYKISDAKFFEEASIADITEVLQAIDSQELMTGDNNDVANTLNNSLNTVLNNALFGTLTDNDYAKIKAMPLFAKEGTDLHRFLATYSTLASEAVNAENEEAHQKMFSYLEIFAYNIFNNNHAEPSVFTNDEEFNEAATVTNLFDWWIAYNSFVKPLYTTFCPYDYNDDRFRAWEELEITMQTAMKDPQFEIVCGFSRELEGGNE